MRRDSRCQPSIVALSPARGNRNSSRSRRGAPQGRVKGAFSGDDLHRRPSWPWAATGRGPPQRRKKTIRTKSGAPQDAPTLYWLLKTVVDYWPGPAPPRSFSRGSRSRRCPYAGFRSGPARRRKTGPTDRPTRPDRPAPFIAGSTFAFQPRPRCRLGAVHGASASERHALARIAPST